MKWEDSVDLIPRLALNKAALLEGRTPRAKNRPAGPARPTRRCPPGSQPQCGSHSEERPFGPVLQEHPDTQRKKRGLDLSLTPFAKNNSKWIMDSM